MAHLSGKSGAVEIGTAGDGDEVEVAGIRAWSLDYTFDTLEVTDFADDGVRDYLAGPSGWSGTFEGPKDGAPKTIGTKVSLHLKESETANQLWEGDCMLTGVHPSVSYDGLAVYAYDFIGCGALTVASA